MKRVVIIGGGFAGSFVARKLQHDFLATLIDSKDYFEYTPSILRLVVNPKIINKIRILHKNYLKKADVVVGNVEYIDKNYVHVGKKDFKYDYLVICSGSNYIHIFDARIFNSSKSDRLLSAYDKLLKAKKVLIIGGGLVGVELAAELCTHYKDKEIVLVNSRRLIPRNNIKSAEYARAFLQKRGVKLLLNRAVKINRKTKADVIFVATGIKPNFEFMKRHFNKSLTEQGYIRVNSFLQIHGMKNVFVAGDIANVKEEKTAQNAEKHAEIIVNNLRALEFNRNLKEYKPSKKVFVISLGKYNGIFEYGNFVFHGKIPALIKWLIEKGTMAKHGKLF